MRSQRARESMDAALGHGIVEKRFASEQSGHRARIDDGRARFHLLHGGLCHVEITVEISLQRLVKMFCGKVLEPCCMNLESRIVHEYIQTSEFLDGADDRL